jgi:hypothetical protein
MSDDSIVGWSWSGIAPIAMSLLLLLMLMASDALFAANPLPMHDEDAADHIGMILMYGQVPIILYFAFAGRHRIKRMLPVLLVQCLLWVSIFAAVAYLDRASEELVARRIEKNAPLPGSETVLRRQIQDQQRGQPNYASMGPAVARYVRRELPLAQKELESLGVLRSMAFQGVDRIGWDIYAAHFDNGDQVWRIFITPDEKTYGLTRAGKHYGCQSSEVYECRMNARFRPDAARSYGD